MVRAVRPLLFIVCLFIPRGAERKAPIMCCQRMCLPGDKQPSALASGRLQNGLRSHCFSLPENTASFERQENPIAQHTIFYFTGSKGRCLCGATCQRSSLLHRLSGGLSASSCSPLMLVKAAASVGTMGPACALAGVPVLMGAQNEQCAMTCMSQGVP